MVSPRASLQYRLFRPRNIAIGGRVSASPLRIPVDFAGCHFPRQAIPLCLCGNLPYDINSGMLPRTMGGLPVGRAQLMALAMT